MKDKEKQLYGKANCKTCIHSRICHLRTFSYCEEEVKEKGCEHYQPKLPEDSVMFELKYAKIKFPNYKKFMESKSYTEKHYETRYNEFSGESYSKLISVEYERNVVKGSYAIRLEKTNCCIVAFINDTPCEYYVNDEMGYEQAVEYLNKRHFKRCEQLLIDYKF